jgi:hypothetical protein
MSVIHHGKRVALLPLSLHTLLMVGRLFPRRFRGVAFTAHCEELGRAQSRRNLSLIQSCLDAMFASMFNERDSGPSWPRRLEAAVIRRVLLSMGLVVASVSYSAAQGYDKAWVDVNIGVAAAAENSYTSARVLTISQEAGGGAVAYSLPRGASFDIGAGYLFNPRIGIGISLGGTAHEDQAGLAVSVPHPLYFNASATDATVTSGTLARAEGAWHLQAMLVAVQTPRLRVRVFGGPSYFRAQQDTITGIKYDQTYQVFGLGNTVDISSYQTQRSEGSGWGAHAGGDISVFFNRVVGLGALVRISRGSVSMDDYGGVHDVKVGGVQFGGGLRLKF